MMDTVDLLYAFPNKYAYNCCYTVIDQLSVAYGMRIHKDKNYGRQYITTAFKDLGFCKVTFFKTEYGRFIKVWLKPIRFKRYRAELGLTQYSDYEGIVNTYNHWIDKINTIANYDVLPHIDGWNVARIDYAIDIETPYVEAYLKLFNSGYVPYGYDKTIGNDKSFYMESEYAVYNFYDKIAQVKDKHGYTDASIQDELGYLPSGILRLEVQCHAKTIFHLKDLFHFPDTTFKYYFQPWLAERNLKKRIMAIVGKNDFFRYNGCIRLIEARKGYALSTKALCCKIMRELVRSQPNICLEDIKEIWPNKKQFIQLIHKIRKIGINPIPLDVCYDIIDPSLTYLDNPCNLLTTQLFNL